MTYPITKNRKALTNALERAGFIANSRTGSFLRHNDDGRAIAFAVIEENRSGRFFAVVKPLGFAQ